MKGMLSKRELVDLTSRTKKSKQIECLQDWGIPFRERPDGSIMTTQEAVNAALNGSTRTRPNLEAARRAR